MADAVAGAVVASAAKAAEAEPRANVEATNKAVSLRIIISLKVILHQERCTLTGSLSRRRK
ncbi:hypothetical protein D3C77_719350 [compost metagenome]